MTDFNKIYLAARYSRRDEVAHYQGEARLLGFDVTSRWLEGTHEIVDGRSRQADDASRQRFAREDWDDLVAADIVISFTEGPDAKKSRGGRHVEFGAALALKKWCIVVGPAENVFHHMPEVVRFATWEEAAVFITALRGAGLVNPHGMILWKFDDSAVTWVAAPSVSEAYEVFLEGHGYETEAAYVEEHGPGLPLEELAPPKDYFFRVRDDGYGTSRAMANVFWETTEPTAICCTEWP